MTKKRIVVDFQSFAEADKIDGYNPLLMYRHISGNPELKPACMVMNTWTDSPAMSLIFWFYVCLWDSHGVCCCRTETIRYVCHVLIIIPLLLSNITSKRLLTPFSCVSMKLSCEFWENFSKVAKKKMWITCFSIFRLRRAWFHQNMAGIRETIRNSMDHMSQWKYKSGLRNVSDFRACGKAQSSSWLEYSHFSANVFLSPL